MLLTKLIFIGFLQTVTPFGPAAPAPIVPPPQAPGTVITTPFGPIVTPPSISNDVAAYIGTLLYGADLRMQEILDISGTVVQVCMGKQQYFPSQIQTPFGPSTPPNANKPSEVKWTCSSAWTGVLSQILTPPTP